MKYELVGYIFIDNEKYNLKPNIFVENIEAAYEVFEKANIEHYLFILREVNEE